MGYNKKGKELLPFLTQSAYQNSAIHEIYELEAHENSIFCKKYGMLPGIYFAWYDKASQSLVFEGANGLGVISMPAIKWGVLITLYKTADRIVNTPRLVEGGSQELRKNLKEIDGFIPPNHQAHHVLPTNIIEKKMYLLDLMSSNLRWNPHKSNGIFLPIFKNDKLPEHCGSHSEYDNYISEKLDREYEKLEVAGKTDDASVLIMVNKLIKEMKIDIRAGRFTGSDGKISGSQW